MNVAGPLSSNCADGNPVLDLVYAALDATRNCRLVDLLEHLGRVPGAVGCVLWEAVPPHPGEQNGTRGDSLYVLESWFDVTGFRFARHDLPISGSIAGRALL